MTIIQSFRASAEQKFKSLLPINTKSDEFKFTSLESFSFQKFGSDMASRLVAIKDLGDKYPNANVIKLSSSSSEVETTGDFGHQGVMVLPWGEFQKKFPKLFDLYAPVPEKLDKDPYAQWTSAHALHGIVVIVKKDSVVKDTIQIIHKLESSLMSHRVLVIVEEGASCSVLEEYRFNKDLVETYSVPAQVASLVQIECAPNSKVEWNQIQSLHDNVCFVMRAQVTASHGAQVSGSVVSLGSKVSHYHLDFCAAGENSNLDFICASQVVKNRHCDFFVRNSHPSKNTTSHTRILNVVSDESMAVFNGMIEIPKNAPKVDAAHRARSLVLSPKARVQANPKLEISTDDVKCAHGASISSIDPAQMYYLQSRGISKADAESMIVDSFLNPALDRIPVDGVRSHYKGLVAKLRSGVHHSPGQGI